MGGNGEAQAAESIDFTPERERHLRFVGREDVLARLDAWLLGPNDTRRVLVTGGPGMGKSALLANWLDRREAAGAQVPHHFVRRQVMLQKQALWASAEAYRPRHDWICEPTAERPGRTVIRVHHATLARTLARWPSTVAPTTRQYALRPPLRHAKGSRGSIRTPSFSVALREAYS